MSTTKINPDQGPQLQVGVTIGLVVPSLVVILRFWSRVIQHAVSNSRTSVRFWWDDWTVLAASLVNIGECIIGHLMIDLGLGRHVGSINPENISSFLNLLWISYFFVNAGMAFAKASALFLYARIFGQTTGRFKYTLWIAHALNVLCFMGNTLAFILEVTLAKNVCSLEVFSDCISYQDLWLGDWISNLFVDAVILVLPMPILWRLQMRAARKAQVFAVFVCGYLFAAATIGDLITTLQAGPKLQDDPTWYMVMPSFWIGFTTPIAIVDVCLPSIFFLFQHARREGFRSLFSRRARSRNSRSKLLDWNSGRGQVKLAGGRDGPTSGEKVETSDVLSQSIAVIG